MNYNSQNRSANNFSPKVLLILGLILTIAIIFGIKLLVVEDAGDSLPRSSAQDSIFKDERSGSVLPGSIPAARSEATSGDSLAIFEKANEGYSSDGAASTAAARQAPQTGRTPPAPAPVKKKAAAASKKLRQGTVIPRLQGGKSFGSGGQEKQGLPNGADMSEILKQAGQKRETGN
ncbi:MAG: hypothetical protein PHV36_06480 [Elusimicrobiales bacterium]|nr:hypothetical protein [Elusimicrobiales bacterium]